MLTESYMIQQATLAGMDEELLSYAKQIQRQLSTDGDEALWLDCLEMAYNELILNKLHWEKSYSHLLEFSDFFRIFKGVEGGVSPLRIVI